MIRIVTAPAAYPATLAEAKEWCRIDTTDTSQDNTINLLIQAMTKYAEETLTGRAFVERTLELSADHFPYCFELPYPPLIGVDAITYTDTSEATQTVAASEYEVDTISEPGRVRLLSGNSWPSLGTRFNRVKIQYRAGYRPTASPTDLTDNSYLPPQLRTWLAARICTLYDNRDHLIVGVSVQSIPRDLADGALDSLVVGTRFF